MEWWFERASFRVYASTSPMVITGTGYTFHRDCAQVRGSTVLPARGAGQGTAVGDDRRVGSILWFKTCQQCYGIPRSSGSSDPQ